MPPAPPFGTQLIGQTEKALNAILDRQLIGTGLTEPQWVTLTVAVMSGGTIDHESAVSRIAGALKISAGDAQAKLDELAAAKLLEISEDQDSPIMVTNAGSELHARIRTAVTEITNRLWGDLSADELATAARVLNTVLSRANKELA